MANLERNSCLITHQVNISIYSEASLCPADEYNSILSLFLWKLSGSVAAKCSIMLTCHLLKLSVRRLVAGKVAYYMFIGARLLKTAAATAKKQRDKKLRVKRNTAVVSCNTTTPSIDLKGTCRETGDESVCVHHCEQHRSHTDSQVIHYWYRNIDSSHFYCLNSTRTRNLGC